jgi:phage gp36-like protein
MAISVANGLGGVGSSYATPNDLQFLSMPNFGDPAAIDGNIVSLPFTVTGLSLIVTVTIDGLTQPEYTYTFPADYATLDLLVAAISIPGLIAVNNGGVLRLRTTKVGISQGLTINHLGTANEKVGFNKFFDTTMNGRSTLTSDITEDEMIFALVAASSLANGYLKRRYLLPITSWSYDLIQVICDIAAYNIAKRQGFNPEVYDANWVNKYNAGIKWLEDVGNRREHPVIVSGGEPLAPTASTQGTQDDIRGWGNVIGSRGNYPSTRPFE